MYDALIIGAGPAGSGVAESLALQGYRVLVVEEHSEVGQAVCCSGIIGRECLEHFSLPEELALREASSATFHSPGGKVLRLEKATPQAYIFDRASLDKALALRAERAGAEYLLSARASALYLDGQVKLEVEHGGKVHSFLGRTLVIATGFGSPLPQRLGMGEIKEFVIAAQAEVEVQGIEEVEVYHGQRVAPGFFAWLVPTASGRGLAGLMASQPVPYFQVFLQHLQKEGKVAASGPPNYARIPLRPLPRSYGERVVAVGEVAGQVKPTTGGGIYYGLIAAQCAGQALGLALERDDFSLLSRYESQWKRKLGPEMARGRWLRRLYARLSDGQMERGFQLLADSDLVKSFLEDEGFSFDWHAAALGRFLVQGGAKALFSGLVGRPLHIFGRRLSS